MPTELALTAEFPLARILDIGVFYLLITRTSQSFASPVGTPFSRGPNDYAIGNDLVLAAPFSRGSDDCAIGKEL